MSNKFSPRNILGIAFGLICILLLFVYPGPFLVISGICVVSVGLFYLLCAAIEDDWNPWGAQRRW